MKCGRTPIPAPPAPSALPDPAPLLAGHEADWLRLGYTPHQGRMVIVEKQLGANTLTVTRGVEQALEQMKPALSGVAVDPTIFRPATFIEMSLHNLSRALLVGCVLVILVLMDHLLRQSALSANRGPKSRQSFF